MLRVIIVDDEPPARRGLRRLLDKHSSVEIVGEAGSVAEAEKLIEAGKPNGIFLDIRMPGASGFDLLRQLEHAPKVVFVTAHAAHAVEAFNFEAVDYLLKPVSASRLARAVERLERACHGEHGTSPWDDQDRICLQTPGRTLVAHLSEVAALQADGDFTKVYVAGEKPLMICQSLRHFESVLPKPPFLRLDRSLLMNLDRVREMEGTSRDHADITVEGVGAPFSVGRQGRLRLRKSGFTQAG